MHLSKGYRKLLVAGIAILTFGVWFADGYLQWVNSDTAGEASGVAQYVGFPYALISDQHRFHARIMANIFPNLTFHTVGYLYRELTGDPVNALFVAQGVMTGTIYMLLVLISAAYVSFSAPMFSGRYIFSAMLLMLFTMALPAQPLLNVPLSLSIRFFHQSVMANYVGTLVVALAALFPYWRHVCTGKWDDWYSDVRLRIPYYALIFAAVFSSTATMIWLGVVCGLALLWFVWRAVKTKIDRLEVRRLVLDVLNDSRAHPLVLILVLVVIGIVAESSTHRSQEVMPSLYILEYFKTFVLFFRESRQIGYFLLSCVFLAFIISWRPKRRAVPLQSALAGGQVDLPARSMSTILSAILPWLVIGNVTYIFIIGLPKVPYRFGGQNLGPDTALPATWTLALWLIAALLYLWEKRRLTWLAPLLIFVLFTNSVLFFSFPRYEARENQIKILSSLFRENSRLPLDRVLSVPVQNLAFSQGECRHYTIPMLRQFGIVSAQREVACVMSYGAPN